MHSPRTTYETLGLLWHNYHALCEQVDIETMPNRKALELVDGGLPLRPFRIATWLATQSFFIAAWGLWEYYSRTLCEGLPKKVKRKPSESSVDWVDRSLTANDQVFAEYEWFSGANSLRNLIAHYAARVVGARPKQFLVRSKQAFPDLETWRDGYVEITYSHVSGLRRKIEDFIKKTACLTAKESE